MFEMRTFNISDDTECWYRYDDYSEAVGGIGVDGDWEYAGYSRTKLRLTKYPVIKHTPKGVWLDNYGTKRFVRREAIKRFACPTEEEALESFIARKARQVSILTSQLEQAKKAKKMAEESLTQ